MSNEQSESPSNGADEGERGGVGEMLGFGGFSRGNDLFCDSFRDSCTAEGDVGSLSCFEHEGINTFTPCFDIYIYIRGAPCANFSRLNYLKPSYR